MAYKDSAVSFLEDLSKDITVLILDFKMAKSIAAQEAILKELDELLIDASYTCHKLAKHLED